LELASKERASNVRQAISKLSLENREVIMLRLYCGMTFKEIANSQQVSAAAVHSRYQQAITQLMSLLNGELKT
jgi:RNA polymerase sigma factor (sigma-70 family)